MSRPYEFSSLTALVCFEAAARHVSFKTAATELNVTPAAVSHQIKALEADLGQPLFRRHHRGVELTETGAFLYVALQRGFEAISDAIERIRARPEAVDVTIQATTAMSSFWLTPQIASFWKSHPGIAVSQLVSDVDVPISRCDLSIHYGVVPQDGGEYRLLFRDRIVALGTRAFAAEHRIETIEDLRKAPLIHHMMEESGWTGWPDWFAALGCKPPQGRRFAVNNYMIALQAAQDDMGATLGWDGLVGGLIKEGRLVELVPESLPSPGIYYLKIHPRATAKARLFSDWLVANQNQIS